jgi:hypothetical protein
MSKIDKIRKERIEDEKKQEKKMSVNMRNFILERDSPPSLYQDNVYERPSRSWKIQEDEEEKEKRKNIYNRHTAKKKENDKYLDKKRTETYNKLSSRHSNVPTNIIYEDANTIITRIEDELGNRRIFKPKQNKSQKSNKFLEKYTDPAQFRLGGKMSNRKSRKLRKSKK